MTMISHRRDYLAELERLIKVIPLEERTAAIEFYDGYIQDSGDDARAIKSLGDVRDLAASIIADWAQRRPENEKQTLNDNYNGIETIESVSPTQYSAQNNPVKPKRRRSASKTAFIAVLAIFAAPIGLPIAISVGAVFLAIAVALLAVFVSVGAVGIAFIPGGIISVITGFSVVFNSLPDALYLVGSGLAMLGISYFIVKYTFAVSRFIFRKLTHAAGGFIARTRNKKNNRNREKGYLA